MAGEVPVAPECFFCAAELPPLDPADLPARERIAYDPKLGRLWRVCAQCTRWNPVPLEARWETLEDCERLTRDDGDLLLTGDHLALFAVGAGQLVRVGDPPRVDFADWRYSERLDEFPIVKQSSWISRILRLPERPIGVYYEGDYGAGGYSTRSVQNPWIGRPFIEHGTLLTALFAEVPLAETCPECGGPLLLYPPSFGDARLLLQADHPMVAAMCALCRRQVVAPLREARPALRAALGIVGRHERETPLVRTAALPIERVGGADAFVHQLGKRQLEVGSMSTRDRLALWICLDEQSEAEALEAEWRRAEELASILDRDLTDVPGFEEFRAQVLGQTAPPQA